MERRANFKIGRLKWIQEDWGCSPVRKQYLAFVRPAPERETGKIGKEDKE
jgi:hypothetical protein